MSLKEECKILDFKELGDERGKLVAIESLVDVPFEIKRVFYVYGLANDTVRGQHANKESQFVLINLRGACKIRLYNDSEEYIVNLNKPNIGIFIPKMIWKDMYDFSEDSLLLSLSDQHYNIEEYIKK